MRGGLWIVVGGSDRGGIIVRAGPELSSKQEEERLSYGAIIEAAAVAGERLQYSLLAGSGPREGWISTRLKSKDLVVPVVPDVVAGKMPAELADQRPEMTFYAISDVHAERKENMAWVQALPRTPNSTLLVAGDLGVSLHQVDAALRSFKEKFDHVFYCYGNHETWCKVHVAADNAIASYGDSYEKLAALRDLCDSLGVITTARLIAGVWVVPVLGWYHSDWDVEPPLQAPPGQRLDREPPEAERFATDTHACKWGGVENGSRELAQRLDAENERWGVWPLPQELKDNLREPRGQRRHPVISFSHFLPRVELMPEKRFLFQPNLPKIVGSDFVRQRVRELEPDLHVFGHSHFPWDMTLDDGVRYRSWPLGTPEEQSRRIASIPTQEVEQWYPAAVFDSEGSHYRSGEPCWFSLMYTRIKREPESCHMASYVAAAYCKAAPVVPETIISPWGSLQPGDEEQRLRREKHFERSNGSVRKEVQRASISSGR